MKKRKTEGSSMIASSPYNPNREPLFVDMVCREFEKLMRQGSISPSRYSRAVDLSRVQTRVLQAIYSKVANGTMGAVRFILNQIPK